MGNYLRSTHYADQALGEFINKLDKCKEHLQEVLALCMKLYDNRPKALKYVYKNTIHNIDYRHIVFIDKEQESKRCTIQATVFLFK